MRRLARFMAYWLMKFGTGGSWTMDVKASCPDCDTYNVYDVNLLEMMKQLR